MYKYLFSLFIFTFFTLATYTQEWVYSEVLKSSDIIEPKFSITDGQGNNYILAHFKETVLEPQVISNGNYDLLLLKYNDEGQLLWYKQIGGTGLDNPAGLIINNNELLVIVNFQNSIQFTSTDILVSNGSFDVGLCKYNALNGDYIESKLICTSDGESDSQVVIDSKLHNSSLIITGNFTNKIFVGVSPNIDTLFAEGYNTSYISKIDIQGNALWSKRILSSTNYSRTSKIAITNDGYYFGGQYRGKMIFDIGSISSYSAGFNDNFIYKTNFDGNGQWIRKIYGEQTENLQSLISDDYSNIYALGNYGSPILWIDSTSTIPSKRSVNLGNFDTYFCKYNRSGILQWLVLKGSNGRDIYNDFVKRDSLIFATGYFTGEIIFNNDTIITSSINNSDAFVASFNQLGDAISGISIFGTGDYEDAGTLVKMDANSRAYVSGYYKSPQIQIGDQTYTSDNINKSDLFFAIYQQPLKAVITNERMVSCNGLSDGMLAVTPYFGRPPFTYSWSHDASLHDPVADNLAAGTYTVTITDANDSTASIAGVVTQSAALAIDSVITPVTCYNNGQDGAIDITVSGGTKSGDYNYYWTTINGNGIVPLNQDQTGLFAGKYVVQVKDANQCSITEDFTVLQPAPFNFSTSIITDIVNPDISKGSIDLEVTGGNTPYASFAWAGPGGYTASTEDIGNLDQVGFYTVTVTDGKGCVTDTTFGIIDNLAMFAEISSKTDVLCYNDNNGSATVTVHNGTPPYTYKWDDEATTRNDATRPNMVPGLYTVTVTDDADITSLPANVVINSPSSSLTLFVTSQNLRCAGDNSGVINLSVSGGTLPYSYSWSNGYNGEDLVNVAAGDYTITVTDNNGCTAQASKTLTQPASLLITPANSGAILCHGERSVDVLANVTGGLPSTVYPHYDFVWDDPGTQTTPTAYDLGAGTYHITVTDSSQCSMTTTVIIDEPDELSYTAVVTNSSCPGDEDGSIVITPVGGTGPGYEFVWDNGTFTRFNTDIPEGRYILTMNDANYCTIVDTFFLTDPEPLEIVSTDLTPVSCENLNSGSITITASGGTGDYEYSVNGGASYLATSTIGSLAVGNYEVIVRDERGCISESIDTALTLPEVCGMVIYSAFSPNDDGKNEVWNIGNAGSFPNIKVKIFNIWGKEVFSSKGYAEPWDGTYNGNDLPAGTYYYVIDPGDGSDVLSGDVSIVK